MMNGYLSEFLEEFDYPAESRQVLQQALSRMEETPQSHQLLWQILDSYDRDRNCDFAISCRNIREASRLADVHPYTGQLLMWICLSRRLQMYYQQAGIRREVWHNSMMDLRYKLFECKAVYGIWGTFVDWFGYFYSLKRFAVGRFQFDMISLGRHYEKNGVSLTPDSRVLNVHIPRTGTRMDRETVDRTFAEAAGFFRDWFGGEPVVFVCDSWLLFEKHRRMLPASSNIVGFMDHFDIVEQRLFDDYEEIWRFFDCLYTPDLDKLPQDSTLRRQYVDLMRRGEKTGCGFGIYVYSK